MKVDLDQTFNCDKELTLNVIGGKWKLIILWHLGKEGTKRFGELKSLLPDISQKVLSHQLRDLEENQIVSRTVYPVIPPKVEYKLTEHGQALKPVLESMYQWGTYYRENVLQQTTDIENPTGTSN